MPSREVEAEKARFSEYKDAYMSLQWMGRELGFYK